VGAVRRLRPWRGRHRQATLAECRKNYGLVVAPAVDDYAKWRGSNSKVMESSDAPVDARELTACCHTSFLVPRLTPDGPSTYVTHGDWPEYRAS